MEKTSKPARKYQFTDFYCVLLKENSFSSGQSVGEVLKNIHQKTVGSRPGFARSGTAGEGGTASRENSSNFLSYTDS